MAIEKPGYSFPDTTALKIPYTCSDQFVVTQKESFKYHLLIEELFHDDSFYSFEFEPTFAKLTKGDQKELSFAFLERGFFREKFPSPGKDAYPMFSAAALIYPSLGIEDMAFAVTFLRRINEEESDIRITEETVFFESLEQINRIEKLPEAMIKELSRRFKHFLALHKKWARVVPDDLRLSVLTGKLIGEYSSTKIFQEDLDPDFATGAIEQVFYRGFPLTKGDPYHQEHLLLAQLFPKTEERYPGESAVKGNPVYTQIMGAERTAQKNYLMATLYRMIWSRFDAYHDSRFGFLANALVRRKLAFTEKELILVIEAYQHPKAVELRPFNIVTFFKNIERHVKDNGLSEPMEAMLKKLSQKEEDSNYDQRELRKLKNKAQEILLGYSGSSGEAKVVAPFLWNEDDEFGKMANQDIANLAAPLRDQWYEFLRLVNTAKGGKPTAKFLKIVGQRIPQLGEKELISRMESWMAYIVAMEFTQVNNWYGYFISSNNVSTLKGLVWSLSLLEIDGLHESLERLIVRCFKKIPGVGPASGALGNACIYTIATKNSLPGVALLNRVRSKIAQRNTKGLIDRYIGTIAEKLKISISDLEDFSIEDFGLIDGVKEVTFNDYTARLTLPAFAKTKLEWIKPDGKLQKSIPAFVRKDFAAELKELRTTAKLIPKTLSLQRDRLDRSYIQKRNLPYPHFQKYYLQHGLMAFLTQKLIWVFSREAQTATAIWQAGQWRDVAGNEIDWIDEQTSVQLWHPLHSETEEILQWRDLLQDQEIKQPFKQAYREVYILTEAEINTRSYSNRMAAHILKQHQFNALAGLRGWKYQLLGAYDDGRDGEVCSMPILDYDLKAEYWVNELNAEDAYNDTGIWLYVATDQIRFTQGGNAVDLIDVPKIIFSEVMRDVDLYVGVASVGNDPAWQDNGGLPQFHDYWQSYSFGDLTEVAKTRKTILEKLLPRLKIAKVASIQGKFLVVQGSVRTYKIHIGSTNILMEPNDQYLCIVPARSTASTDKLFIPFEGDRGLSILLSKAFLLAEDDKIEDATILSQIKH